MFCGRVVAVVIPACNEADKIAATIRSVPGFVDHVIVVDDGSADATAAIARRAARASRGAGARSRSIVHDRNRGVGAAITTGYARALELGAQATAVMAGDGQMDPADLPRLLAPVVDGQADYAKGNRFAWPGGWRAMPAVRLIGGGVLSWLTRLASGYWHVGDSQCGYTVASRRALLAIGSDLFPRYGYPNDLLREARGGARAGRGRSGAPGLRPELAFGVASAAGGAADRLAAGARVLSAACARGGAGHPPSRRRRSRWRTPPARARRHEDRPPHDVVPAPRRRLRRQLRRRSGAALLADGHAVDVLAAGDGARRGARWSTSGSPSRGSPLTLTLSPPGRGEKRTSLFYGAGAPEALERGSARVWLAAAHFSCALAAAARARAHRFDVIESHWLVPERARRARRRAVAPPARVRPLGRRRAARTHPVRAHDRRGASPAPGSRSQFVSDALQARFAVLAAPARSAPSSRWRSRASGRRASGRRRRGPAARSGWRGPRCSRSAGWCRSRATSACCARAPACRRAAIAAPAVRSRS